MTILTTQSIAPTMADLNVGVRPITAADAGFLCRLYASTRAEEMALTGWEQAQIDAFLSAQFQAQHDYYQQHYQGAAFDLILLDGAPIGRIYLARWEDQYRLIDIALLPEQRGNGIGTAFLKAILDEARRAGIALSCHVELFNPALRLYSRLGFRVVDMHGVYYLLKWTEGEEAMLDTLRSADFAPHLNGTFRLYPEPPKSADQTNALELELTEVSDFGGQRPDYGNASGRHPFSLVFYQPQGIYLPQQIYTLEHEAFGRFEIFIVPIGPAPGNKGMRYQAVFT